MMDDFEVTAPSEGFSPPAPAAPTGPDEGPPPVATADAVLGPWRALGASVIGNDHVRHGVPRQDALRVVVLEDWLILAIADGAGSAMASAVARTLR